MLLECKFEQVKEDGRENLVEEEKAPIRVIKREGKSGLCWNNKPKGSNLTLKHVLQVGLVKNYGETLESSALSFHTPLYRTEPKSLRDF